MIRAVCLLILTALVASLSTPAAMAQARDVPYWATLRADIVNLRVGPGPGFPVDWVYRRPGLPVKVVRVMQGWRLVRDPDGAQGWIVGRLLSPERGALVIGEGLTELRAQPSPDGMLKWRVEPGVVGQLGDCEAGWCEFSVGPRSGWIDQRRLWGAGEP